MAKILSQVDTIRRGSVGGVTYTANRYAAIIARARVSPVNPQTDRQGKVRGWFKYAVYRWKLVSDLNRAFWTQYATTCPYLGPVGVYYTSARNLFIAIKSFSQLCENAGLTFSVDSEEPQGGPGWLETGIIKVGTHTVPGTGFMVTFDRDESLSDANFIIELSPPQPLTVNYYNGPFDYGSIIGVLAPAGASTVQNVTGLQAGMRYFMKFRACDKATASAISQPQFFNRVAVTVT